MVCIVLSYSKSLRLVAVCVISSILCLCQAARSRPQFCATTTQLYVVILEIHARFCFTCISARKPRSYCLSLQVCSGCTGMLFRACRGGTHDLCDCKHWMTNIGVEVGTRRTLDHDWTMDRGFCDLLWILSACMRGVAFARCRASCTGQVRVWLCLFRSWFCVCLSVCSVLFFVVLFMFLNRV